ncbi:MAG: hypothetical protein NT080_07905 [Spirochaetes bacterium]|nr:hypothetical protein [Spirochaetota bacterium]
MDRLELPCGFSPIERIIDNMKAVLPEGCLSHLARLERLRDRAELAAPDGRIALPKGVSVFVDAVAVAGPYSIGGSAVLCRAGPGYGAA